MNKIISTISFEIMSWIFNVRDLITPRSEVLQEVGIQEGFIVLDFGCGPGSYILPVAQLVGTTGSIYALDIHPRAIEKVRDIAFSISMRLPKVEAIESDCKTELSDNSVDVVLLYDTFHDLTDPSSVLKEIHRILKPDGILSFSDHHLKEKDIVDRVTHEGRFMLSRKGSKTYTFIKRKNKFHKQRQLQMPTENRQNARRSSDSR